MKTKTDNENKSREKKERDLIAKNFKPSLHKSHHHKKTLMSKMMKGYEPQKDLQ